MKNLLKGCCCHRFKETVDIRSRSSQIETDNQSSSHKVDLFDNGSDSSVVVLAEASLDIGRSAVKTSQPTSLWSVEKHTFLFQLEKYFQLLTKFFLKIIIHSFGYNFVFPNCARERSHPSPTSITTSSSISFRGNSAADCDSNGRSRISSLTESPIEEVSEPEESNASSSDGSLASVAARRDDTSDDVTIVQPYDDDDVVSVEVHRQAVGKTQSLPGRATVPVIYSWHLTY